MAPVKFNPYTYKTVVRPLTLTWDEEEQAYVATHEAYAFPQIEDVYVIHEGETAYAVSVSSFHVSEEVDTSE